MDLSNVFLQILTLFIVGIVGYISRKLQILSNDMVSNLPKFMLTITLPCMIITSMQLDYSDKLLNEVALILLTSIIVYLSVFIISILVSKILKIEDPKDKGVYKFMIMFTNVGFMGYPVILSIFPREILFYAAIYNMPFNLLVFTLGIYLMTGGIDEFNFKKVLNPGFISVVIGFVLFITAIKLPPLIMDPLVMIGDLTSPLSMIFIGASLTDVKIRGIFFEWRLYIVCAIRLVVIPLLLFFILRNITSNQILIGVPVIISAMPIAANSAIISKEYGGNLSLASKGIFISTLLSIITIPLITYIIFA